MRRPAGYVIRLLAVGVTLTSGGHALAADASDVKIVIHVENYAGISPTARSGAAAEVRRIYARAGIQTVWATAEEPTDSAGLHVRVALFSGTLEVQKIRAEALSNIVFGLAYRETGRAYIFTHRIASLAVRHGGDFQRLLGRVIAHEVGHLALPVSGHADRGIMRANIGIHSKQGSEFTMNQSVAMRSMITAASRSPTHQAFDRSSIPH
jgi:hypothetical protein